MNIYFNKKTNATQEFKDSEFKKLPPEVRKRWRLATDAEIKIHEKRVADQKILADKEDARKKAKAKADKEKQKKYSKLAPKKSTDEKSGSTEKAESEGSKTKQG